MTTRSKFGLVLALSAVGFVASDAAALRRQDFMCEDNGLKFSYERHTLPGPKGTRVETCWFTMTSCGHVLEHYQVPVSKCDENGPRHIGLRKR